MNHVTVLQALGLRVEGSDAEDAAFRYITDVLTETNVDYTVRPLNNPLRGHSHSRNVMVFIQGLSPDVLILAVPVDGGAFGVGLLLETARIWSNETPPRTLHLLFLGGEPGNDEFHPYGSRDYLNTLKVERQSAALYFQGDRVPETWIIKPGSGGMVAPSWLIRILTTVMDTMELPFRLRGTDIQVARLGLSGETIPLKTWLKAGVPVLGVEGGGEGGTAMTERSLEVLDRLVRDPDPWPKVNERMFFYLRTMKRGQGRLINEGPYILIFLTVVVVFTGVILSQTRKIRLNFRRHLQFWWVTPMLLVLVFLFFFLSTLIIEEVTLIIDFPEVWRHAPSIFLFFKIFVTGVLSLIFLHIMRGLALPRTPHYYAYTSIGMAVLGTLIICTLDITLAVLPLWALICLSLFTAVRRESFKIVFLLLSLIPHIAALAVIIDESYTEVLRTLLFSRIQGNALQTLLLLPAILAITSLGYISHHYRRERKSFIAAASTISFGIGAVFTLIWILSMNPYGPQNPQPVTLIDKIELNEDSRRVELSSPKPMGSVRFTLEGRNYSLSDLGRNASVRTPLTRMPLNVTATEQTFLGRRTYTIHLNGESDPEKLTLLLTSPRSFTLHEASHPFEVHPQGNSAEIFVGLNPPFPLKLHFTANDSAILSLIVEARWNNPENPPKLDGKDMTDTVLRTTREVMNLASASP